MPLSQYPMSSCDKFFGNKFVLLFTLTLTFTKFHHLLFYSRLNGMIFFMNREDVG